MSAQTVYETNLKRTWRFVHSWGEPRAVLVGKLYAEKVEKQKQEYHTPTSANGGIRRDARSCRNDLRVACLPFFQRRGAQEPNR